MMTIFENVSQCKKKECLKKAFFIENGYIVEKLVPSGSFRVKNEAVNRMVVVSSLKEAKRICRNNCESE